MEARQIVSNAGRGINVTLGLPILLVVLYPEVANAKVSLRPVVEITSLEQEPKGTELITSKVQIVKVPPIQIQDVIMDESMQQVEAQMEP